MKKIIISKSKLIKLYIIQRKTQIEIAKIFHIHTSTIKARLREYNLEKPKLHFYCKDCNKEIGFNSVKYGKGTCQKCARKRTITSNSKYSHYQKCIDCGKRKSGNSGKKCRKCYCIWSKNPKNNPMYGRKGKKHPAFGNKAPNIRPKIFKKIKMRSSWEVKFAKWCEKKKIKWYYEPKIFDLETCTYTPDFYLPKQDEYVEIKGWWRDEIHNKGKLKIKLLKQHYPDIKIKILMKKELQKMGVL